MAMLTQGLGWKLCALGLLLGCGAHLDSSNRDVRIAAGRSQAEAGGPSVTQTEMQQAVQRFTGEFLDNLVQACEPLTRSESARSRREGVRLTLVYSASVLDIASGPYPEVNTLDLVVFIRLSRGALERYWMPEIFGNEARELVTAFTDSEERAWQLASKILTDEQREKLNGLIQAWEYAHPDQVRVEMVRFDAFSARAGKVTEDLQKNAAGLLGSVKEVTQAADQAVLLAERGMFLAHRLPFLMRLQARVGAQELVTDSLGRLSEVETWITGATGGTDVLDDMGHLIDDSRVAVHEARLTLEELKPLLQALPRSEELQATIASGNDLADKALALLREARALTPDDPQRALSLIEAGAERMLQRLVFWLGLLGAALIMLFWGGYYAVRRL